MPVLAFGGGWHIKHYTHTYTFTLDIAFTLNIKQKPHTKQTAVLTDPHNTTHSDKFLRAPYTHSAIRDIAPKPIYKVRSFWKISIPLSGVCANAGVTSSTTATNIKVPEQSAVSIAGATPSTKPKRRERTREERANV
jgi:hypothetical protein